MSDDAFDVCWCGHTRIQHGLLSPELCNFCKECSGFTYDIAINSNRILNEMQDEIRKNTITDSDVSFIRQDIMDDYDYEE